MQARSKDLPFAQIKGREFNYIIIREPVFIVNGTQVIRVTKYSEPQEQRWCGATGVWQDTELKSKGLRKVLLLCDFIGSREST